MVYDGYVRVLYVIRDNSSNVVTWNWSEDWQIQIQDILNPGLMRFHGFGNDTLFKNNGPISQATIASTDWIFSSDLKMQFLNAWSF